MRSFTYKCDCVKSKIDSIIENYIAPEEVEEIDFDPVSWSGYTASMLKYKIVGKKRVKQFFVVHTFCPFCGKRLIEVSE